MSAQGRTVRLFSMLSQTKSFTGHLRSSAAVPGAGKEFSQKLRAWLTFVLLGLFPSADSKVSCCET